MMPSDVSSHDGPIRQDGDGPQTMLVLPRELESVADARAWLASFLREQRVAGSRRNDAVLVVSELVTNALRHGLGDIVVRSALTDAGVLRLSVTDSGGELPEIRPVDPSKVGGVGLHIVDQLSSQWGISPFPGGKTVWVTMAGDAGR
jgi:anti-sigma regulatory factor (Ser/Thr protein kinase)